MVRTRSFLSVSFAATSRGGNDFAIKLWVGRSRTGTFKCFSTFAAAEVAIGLTSALGAGGWRGIFPEESAPLTRVPLVPAWGMTMVSLQFGHSDRKSTRL